MALGSLLGDGHIFAWMVCFYRLGYTYEHLAEMLARLHCMVFVFLLAQRFLTFMLQNAYQALIYSD